MPNVLPPPALVVRPYRPERTRRLIALVSLAWLITLLSILWLTHKMQQQSGNATDHAALVEAQTESEALHQRIAILERSEQIARTANNDLQQNLRDRQEEIAALRADLAFYSRLTGSNVKREGLAVQGVHLEPVAGARAYNFSITLTQNLKTGQIATGHLRLSVTGVREDKLATLGWAELAPNQNATGLEFGFKYFQQVKGTLMLPEGFAPNRIKVEADAGGDIGHADQEFAWADTLANEEVSDVQQ